MWSVEILDLLDKPYEPPLWFHGHGPEEQMFGSSTPGMVYGYEEEAMKAVSEAPDWLKPRLKVRRMAEKVAK